jgi:multidrug efflux system outer membrane protein
MQTGEPEFCSPDAVKASKKTVDIAMMQYRHGLADYQRVLETQRDLSERQDNLVSTAGSVGQNQVAIYRALGGGGLRVARCGLRGVGMIEHKSVQFD